MRRAIGGLLVILTIAAISLAQQETAADKSTVLLKEGTLVTAALLEPLDAVTSKSNDDFVLTLSEDMTAGGVLIPRGTEILGRVVKVRQISAENKESEITLSFDFLKFMDDFLTFKATVLSVSQPDTTDTGTSNAVAPECAVCPVFKGATEITLEGKNLRLESGSIFKLKMNRDVVQIVRE